MPWPSKKLTLVEFRDTVVNYNWRRIITEVHVHHTFQPSRNYYNQHGGEASLKGMYDFHTGPKSEGKRGWRDFGQHVTIDPDGYIWLCRDWNDMPASATGHNGNRLAGPFMFEAIGDFRNGKEYPPTEKQYESMIGVIGLVQGKFALEPGAFRFHKDMQATECPGDLNKNQMLADIKAFRGDIKQDATEWMDELMEDINDFFNETFGWEN